MDRAEKDKPECEHYDAIAKPLALAPCMSGALTRTKGLPLCRTKSRATVNLPHPDYVVYVGLVYVLALLCSYCLYLFCFSYDKQFIAFGNYRI